MKTHTRSGVMDRKHTRVFSFFPFDYSNIHTRFVFFALLSSPFTHRSVFSAGLCGSGSVVVPATPFRRYGTLWWMTETKASQILLPLYEAVFQSFSMSPKHLESDTKGKRVHSCLHLGTRLLSSSLRRHHLCPGQKAKETGGGSKIAQWQNPCVLAKSSQKIWKST